MTNATAVLFILVYFVVTHSFAAAAGSSNVSDHSNLAASKIQMTPANAVQYLQFEDVSYNFTDFTICTWIKLTNFSQAQTIFRLTGNKKEPVVLWRIHVHPKETMKVTIKNRLVASENTPLARGQWNHVCFQWKGSTGVWAMFVNTKVHSVGQIPAVANDTIPSAAWKMHGTGVGTVGDDGAPNRNGWQVYGLFMTGSTTTIVTTKAAADAQSKTGDQPSSDAPVVKSAGKPAAARTTSRGSVTASKNGNKRQAVFESDSDDPSFGTGGVGGSGAPPSKPFQWFTKTFAFVKRMFTFVIIPFFKFMRNTFFQTRSLDDTVVDVSETHLTVSDVKYMPPSSTTTTTTTTPPTTTAAKTAAAADADFSSVHDFFLDENRDGDNSDNRWPSSSSKRETDIGRGIDDDDDDDDDDDQNVGCSGLQRPADDDRVTAADLVAAGVTSAADDTMTPNTRRYLRMVTDGLNDVGVNVAFVRRTFACCRLPLRSDAAAVMVVDWNRTPARAHNVTVSPHNCGRL